MEDGLNFRNWGYYEPSSLKGNLALQLMSTVAERDTNKSLMHGRDTNVMVGPNGAYHHRDCVVSEPPGPLDYVRESWVNHRDKFLQILPGNPSYGVLPEASAPPHPMQILQQPDSSKDEREDKIEEPRGRKGKKRINSAASNSPKPKKSKKGPSVPKDNNSNSSKRRNSSNNNMDVVINGIDLDISGIPIPVCSCTGTPQQCYRWGCGGWQSACCTTSVSIYPLPMSTKRRGARIAGRKMSQGAFKKVLEKLAAEGYNFSNPIDLRTHWAKHGTNKFVTIR